MKLLKRMLCVLLCVVILSTTVGTKYFDSNHMEKVEATTIVIGAGITLATLFEFCLFVGTTALAAYGIYEGYENREEIARFGKEFIDSCGDTDFNVGVLGSSPSIKSVVLYLLSY